MTFSIEWEKRFTENKSISIWPWSDLVSYVMRYSNLTYPKFSVLELGCGAGANIPFFLSLNVDYYAMEGSTTIINTLKEKFPSIKKNLFVGDFTKEIPFSQNFDLIVDRSSITHNPLDGVQQCLDLIYKKLKNNGKYIGIDWFSTIHSDYKHGKSTKDKHTKKDFQTGQFKNVGMVHFSDKSHLVDLFKKFKILILEHKIIHKEIPNNNQIFASWNLVAQKHS